MVGALGGAGVSAGITTDGTLEGEPDADAVGVAGGDDVQASSPKTATAARLRRPTLTGAALRPGMPGTVGSRAQRVNSQDGAADSVL